MFGRPKRDLVLIRQVKQWAYECQRTASLRPIPATLARYRFNRFTSAPVDAAVYTLEKQPQTPASDSATCRMQVELSMLERAFSACGLIEITPGSCGK